MAIRRASRALVALLAFGGLLVAAEMWLRHYVRAVNERDPALWTMLFYSGPIHPEPNRSLSFRLYGVDAKLHLSADFRINNIGAISRRDYTYEQAPGEFRIVVIGGEQTASSVASISWPDPLEDELNRRDPNGRYRVINLAWPDAGPEHYIQYWKGKGVRFQPHLVIVNFVETDFYRTVDGAPLTYQGHPIGHSKLTYRLGPGPDDVARTITANIQGHHVRSLADPAAVPGRPYGFFASAAVFDDRAKVLALQRRLVDDMIRGAIVGNSPLVLHMLRRGRLLRENISTVRNFDLLPSKPIDKERLVEFGMRTFGWLADHIDNLILTHNFNYHEMRSTFDLTEAMMAKAPRIKVIDMRKRVPAGTSEEELKSWYLLPHMSEKWSDKGHEAYARMMADLVLGWRAGKAR